MRRVLIITLLLIVTLTALLTLNQFMAFRDEGQFYSQKGLPKNKNYHDCMEIVKHRLPPGTHRDKVRTEFKDFKMNWSKTTGWAKGEFVEHFVYRLGFLGQFEVWAYYDSLNRIERFDYDLHPI